MYLKNKTVWITGASSGIGRALTIELSKDNNLILSSRNKIVLEKVKYHFIIMNIILKFTHKKTLIQGEIRV